MLTKIKENQSQRQNHKVHFFVLICKLPLVTKVQSQVENSNLLNCSEQSGFSALEGCVGRGIR